MVALLLYALFAIVCVTTLAFAAREASLVLRYFVLRPGVRPSSDQSAPLERPTVTVQIPVYNEPDTAVRVIEAVAAQDYPAHLLDIQVLDDSTDSTTDLIAKVANELTQSGYTITHVRRTNRDGFKAGALAAGLAHVRSELVAVFDADFIPAPNFLSQVIVSERAFSNSRVAFAQARWGYVNESQNWLTTAQSLLLDRHFILEKPVRNSSGAVLHFNGSAGIWRKAAIFDGGGWSADTLTEDLDLSIRCNLRGWKGVYLGHVAVDSEIPSSLSAFKLQQRRWARGSAQCVRKLLPKIVHAPWPRLRRADELLYAAGYIIQPVALLHALLWPWLVHRASNAPVFIAAQLCIGMSSLAAPAVLGLVGRIRKDKPLPFARQLALGIGLSIGLMVNNSVGFLQGLGSQSGTFDRTPKHGDRRSASVAPKHWALWAEAATAMYCLSSAAFLLARGHGLWAMGPLLWGICVGSVAIGTARE